MTILAPLCRILSLLVCLAFPTFLLANHKEQGVINDTFPLTIGSPEFPTSAYSGISLNINPSAPSDLRFKTGQAAWLGTADTIIVDTELEQSVFALDINMGLPLEPNPAPMWGDMGLVIGDLIPQHYYGPFPNGLGPSHLDPHIEVTYRLIGSNALLQGSIESFAFIPEPNAMHITLLGAAGLLFLRKQATRRRDG